MPHIDIECYSLRQCVCYLETVVLRNKYEAHDYVMYIASHANESHTVRYNVQCMSDIYNLTCNDISQAQENQCKKGCERSLHCG